MRLEGLSVSALSFRFPSLGGGGGSHRYFLWAEGTQENTIYNRLRNVYLINCKYFQIGIGI